MKKEKKEMSKSKRYFLRGLTFVLVCGLSFFGAFMLTPHRSRVVGNEAIQETYFSQYLNKSLQEMGTSDDGSVLKLNATVNNLKISWPDEYSSSNHTITFNGELSLEMDSIEDIDFTLKGRLFYDSISDEICLSYIDKSLSLSLDSVLNSNKEYESNKTSYDYDINLDFILELANMLGLDNLLINSSSVSLESALEGLDINEVISGKNVNVILTIDDYCLRMVIDKTGLTLKTINLSKNQINDFVISGVLCFHE